LKLAQDEAAEQQQVSAEYEAAERNWLTEGGDTAAPFGAGVQVDLYLFRPHSNLTTVPRDEAGRPDFNHLRPDLYAISPVAAAAIIGDQPRHHRTEYVVVFAGTRQEVTAPLVAAQR
jgi:hypothetical protein